jgi:hypothetical protein
VRCKSATLDDGVERRCAGGSASSAADVVVDEPRSPTASPRAPSRWPSTRGSSGRPVVIASVRAIAALVGGIHLGPLEKIIVSSGAIASRPLIRRG